MKKITVTQTIQVRDEPPVEVMWSRRKTPIEAASAVAQILARIEEDQSDVPESVRYVTLSISVTIEDEV